jgi:hypothetical protein
MTALNGKQEQERAPQQRAMKRAPHDQRNEGRHDQATKSATDQRNDEHYDQRDDERNGSAATNATTSMTARARARSTTTKSTTAIHDKQEHAALDSKQQVQERARQQAARAGARSMALSLSHKDTTARKFSPFRTFFLYYYSFFFGIRLRQATNSATSGQQQRRRRTDGQGDEEAMKKVTNWVRNRATEGGEEGEDSSCRRHEYKYNINIKRNKFYGSGGSPFFLLRLHKISDWLAEFLFRGSEHNRSEMNRPINPSITRKRGGSHVTVRSADQRYTRCEIKKMDYDHVILPPFPPHARSPPFRFAVTHFLSL